MVLIPDRFQIRERDAAITTRAQSSLESFQTTGNHTKFPVLNMFVEANGYTRIYTHIKAVLKVDGSFLFSLLKDKNKNNQKAFRSTGSDNNNI